MHSAKKITFRNSINNNVQKYNYYLLQIVSTLKISQEYNIYTTYILKKVILFLESYSLDIT